MAVTYGFYNSIGGDRAYNATQLSSLFEGIINDGIFMGLGEALVVNAGTGMNVIVGPGRAWFNQTWTNNDTRLILPVDTSDMLLNRIDLVVLEVNKDEATRANTIKIVKGAPSSTPVAPTLVKTTLVNQYPLAHVYVGAGVTQIITNNITNKVGTSDTPFVTGIIDTVNIDSLLLQWDAEFETLKTGWDTEFNTWFNTIKNNLDGDTAGNLLNNIENHKNDAMPHKFVDGVTTYRWGMAVSNGVVVLNYEEVV